MYRLTTRCASLIDAFKRGRELVQVESYFDGTETRSVCSVRLSGLGRILRVVSLCHVFSKLKFGFVQHKIEARHLKHTDGRFFLLDAHNR